MVALLIISFPEMYSDITSIASSGTPNFAASAALVLSIFNSSSKKVSSFPTTSGDTRESARISFFIASSLRQRTQAISLDGAILFRVSECPQER